jgi:hypothetical protein
MVLHLEKLRFWTLSTQLETMDETQKRNFSKGTVVCLRCLTKYRSIYKYKGVEVYLHCFTLWPF